MGATASTPEDSNCLQRYLQDIALWQCNTRCDFFNSVAELAPVCLQNVYRRTHANGCAKFPCFGGSRDVEIICSIMDILDYALMQRPVQFKLQFEKYQKLAHAEMSTNMKNVMTLYDKRRRIVNTVREATENMQNISKYIQLCMMQLRQFSSRNAQIPCVVKVTYDILRKPFDEDEFPLLDDIEKFVESKTKHNWVNMCSGTKRNPAYSYNGCEHVTRTTSTLDIAWGLYPAVNDSKESKQQSSSTTFSFDPSNCTKHKFNARLKSRLSAKYIRVLPEDVLVSIRSTTLPKKAEFGDIIRVLPPTKLCDLNKQFDGCCKDHTDGKRSVAVNLEVPNVLQCHERTTSTESVDKWQIEWCFNKLQSMQCSTSHETIQLNDLSNFFVTTAKGVGSESHMGNYYALFATRFVSMQFQVPFSVLLFFMYLYRKNPVFIDIAKNNIFPFIPTEWLLV